MRSCRARLDANALHCVMKTDSSSSDTMPGPVFRMLSRIRLHMAMLHVARPACRAPHRGSSPDVSDMGSVVKAHAAIQRSPFQLDKRRKSSFVILLFQKHQQRE
jgi:hypothetical protein